MKNIYMHPETNNYYVDISVEEWIQILCLPELRSAPNILDALEKWYKAPSYTASCKELAKRYSRDYRYFSVQNRKLGEIAVRHINRFHLIGANGRETYWAVAWLEINRNNNVYTLQLRSELVDAIKQLDLFS